MGDWIRLAARLFAWEAAAPMKQRALAAAAAGAAAEGVISEGKGIGAVEDEGLEPQEVQLAPSAARAAEAVAATIGADVLSAPISKAIAAVPSMAPTAPMPAGAPSAAGAPSTAPAAAAAAAGGAAGVGDQSGTAAAAAMGGAGRAPIIAQQPQGLEEAELERAGRAKPRPRFVQPPSPSEGRGPKLAATPMRRAIESHCAATDAAVRHLVSLSRNTLLPENRNGHEAGSSPGLYIGFHDTRTPTPSDGSAGAAVAPLPTIPEEATAGGSPPTVYGGGSAGAEAAPGPLTGIAAGQPSQPRVAAPSALVTPAATRPRFEDIVDAVLAGQRAMRHAARASGGASAGARCDISVGDRKRAHSASVGGARGATQVQVSDVANKEAHT